MRRGGRSACASSPKHARLLLLLQGDVDLIVPFPGTRAWLKSMALDTEVAFHAWSTPSQQARLGRRASGGRPRVPPTFRLLQVGGYAYILANPSGNGGRLHFSSVRNAGHLVPELQGQRSLQLFAAFLNGQDL